MNCRNSSTAPPRRPWRSLRALVLGVGIVLSTLPSMAQIAYSFNFDANSTGWTGNFSRFTGTTACGGSGGAMRRNLYASATTGQLVSPLTGTATGGQITITYTYKVANWSANNVATAPPWGQFNVQYGATATGPWTTIATVSNETQLGNPCISKSHTFTPPGGALFVRWDALFAGAGDYYMNFDNVTLTEALPACSGTPNAGLASASVTGACSGTNFNLSASGLTGLGSPGISYQWQSSTDGGTTWNNITGATAATATVNQSVATQYRIRTTCSNSGLSNTSNVVSIGMNLFYTCYCASSASSTADEEIFGVTLGSGTVTSTCATVAPGPGSIAARYGNYRTNPPLASIEQGQSYTLSLNLGSCGTTPYARAAKVWIDWNQDGTFNNTAELVYSTGDIPNTTGLPTTNTGTVAVPITAVVGTTGMRVSYFEVSAATINPCYAGTWGEVEDHLVAVTLAPPCAGAPTAGTAVASVTSGCGTVASSALSLTGSVFSGSGITYQWESSVDGGATWTPFGTSATTQTVTSVTTTTQYRLVATCTASGQSDTSAPVTITVNPLPTIGITASNGGNFCGSGTLTASGASTYVWQPSAQLVSNTGTTVTSIATANTTFTVTGTDANGCTGTATQAIVYTAPPTVTLSSAPNNFCGTGGTAVLSASSINDPNYTYVWTALDGASISNVQAASVDATVTETSNFLVTATDAGSGCSSVQYQSVGVYPLPAASMSLTPSTPQCAGATITVNSGLSAGNFNSAAITHAPRTAPGTATVLASGGVAVTPLTSGSLDDGGWSSVPVGFTFNFFGTPYTTCNVGTNGTIMFGAYNGAGLADFTYTTLPSTTEPLGMVAVLAMDNDLSTSGGVNGTVRYWTEGYAPNRRFVVQYLNVREFGDTKVSTSQAIFYETLGMVEVHVTSSTNVDRNKLVGINGPTGTIGVLAFASGTVAAANNPISTPFGYRFSPPSNYTTTWSTGATGTNIFSITDVPGAGSTTYSLSYTNQTTGCTNAPGSATITYTEGSPITAGSISPASPLLCTGGSVVLTAVPTDGVGPYTFQWIDPSLTPLGTAQTQAATALGDYIVTITDACGGFISDTVTVTTAPPFACACIPTSAGTSCITNVTFGAVNNTTGCVATASNYISYIGAGGTTTGTFFQGSTYALTVTTDGSAISSMWIDYNQDGVYAADEWVQPMTTGTSGTVNVTIPVTATPGLTGMRVRTRNAGNPNGAGDACSSFGSGEAEDYAITIAVPPPCAGTPSVGNTTASAASVCSGVSFNLALQTQPTESGLTFQWYVSTDGGTPYGPIAGATLPSLTTSQAVASSYYCEVTCTEPGGGVAQSSPVAVAMETPTNCYCTPTSTSGCNFGDLIARVQLNTLDNNSGAACLAFYNNYTTNPALTTTLQSGITYSCIITAGAYSQAYAVWIDYNDDGVFSTPGERLGFTATAVPAGGTASFNVTLACNPPLGVHRMRVRSAWDVTVPGANITPCGIPTDYGEVEDYLVTVTAAVPCPAPSNLAVSASTGSSATLGWNAGCVETAWNVQYGAVGFTLGTGTTIAVSTTPTTTITGLTPGANYHAYVQADCAGNGTSSWVGPLTFSTCNGTCADAVTAVVGVNTAGTMNCGAGASNAAFTGATNARWFSFTAPSAGVMTAAACGAVNTGNDDTRVTIHGGTCGSLSVLASNDDACAWANGGSAFASTASVFMTAGQQVFIEWDDRWNNAGFNWDLTFAACTPDPTDLCVNQDPTASPVTIGGAPVVFTGVLECQTQDGISPNPFPQATGWEWVAFQLTECANVQISYCGTANFQYGALNMYGDCGTAFINSQTFDFTTCPDGNPTLFFTDLSPGFYYYPVLWSLPLNMVGAYQVNVIATAPSTPCAPNLNCAGALPLTCPGAVTGNTNNQFSTLPANGCPFTGSTSGGSLWYTYTAAADENIVLSTCGAATVFNTRISVYTGSGCGSLTCYTMSDDFGGACTNRSQVEFFAQSGQTYYIAVHSPSPFDDGVFELQVGCGAACARPANDDCGNAEVLTSFLADGSAVYTTADNSCALNDAFTTCTPLLNNQGMWYSFNSGANTIHFMDLLGSAQDGQLTASQLNYTLYNGSCSNMGATGQVVCDEDGDGYDIVLPGLTTNTNYLLYVYNPGSTGFEGTFQVKLEHPGVNDAGIVDVISPTGLVCNSFLEPVVKLTNFGEATLTSVQIVYDLDGITGPFTYNWTGSLPYQDTTVVNLPGFTSPYGTHVLNVTVQNPNGQTDEIPGNSAFAETGLDVTGETVVVEITTDNDPTGIYWEIQDQAFQSVATAPAYTAANSTVSINTCVSTVNGNCFSFFLFDFLGDGLSGAGNGNGSWRLRTTDGRTLLGDAFDATVNGVLSPNSPPASAGYVNGHEFCVPPGPSRIASEECGIFTNVLQSKVYATSVSGATNYQFEFSDPDAGFRRRIAVPRNWVRFAEMQSSPLQPGTRYFARVRVDQGASGFADDRFGTGCEMGLDPNAVPGCTGLLDDTSLPAHSCGVTKTFGGSDKIYAQPVVGAVQYRFRFENTGEGYLRTVLRPNYICPLSWVTLPLQNGSTYDVKVEVLYNGQWSGYCGPTCTVTILNPPTNGQQRDAVVTTTTGMQVWPNPVRDGVVNLRLEGLTANTQRISLEVFDLVGQRVIARDVENSGSVFNTVLDMDGFAGGVYLIHLNVDGVMHQQRVSVVK